MASSDTTIGADQRLIVSYEAEADAGSVENAVLTNIAGATEWFGLDPVDPAGRTYNAYDYRRHGEHTRSRGRTHDYCLHANPDLRESTPSNVTTGEDPATVATPGDTIRYTLRVENASDTTVDTSASSTSWID